MPLSNQSTSDKLEAKTAFVKINYLFVGTQHDDCLFTMTQATIYLQTMELNQHDNSSTASANSSQTLQLEVYNPPALRLSNNGMLIQIQN